LRVLSIDIQHFERRSATEAVPRGVLGKESFNPRLGDQVTIEAKLSRSAHAYLLAFRPDGVVELCYPEDESQPPPLTELPCYPPAARAGQVRYGLMEGTGLWAFAVVASETPLPAYRDFIAREAPRWSPRPELTSGVWIFNGRSIEAIGIPEWQRLRGKGDPALGSAAEVVQAAKQLQISLGAESAAAIGFGVGPAK
jgi:hypothetical protein